MLSGDSYAQFSHHNIEVALEITETIEIDIEADGEMESDTCEKK